MGFKALLLGDERQKILLASDAGYGFVTELGHLMAKNKAGKAILNLPNGSEVLPPAQVPPGDDLLVAAVSTEGRLLVFPLADLPELARGKGNKILSIPSARVKSREEMVKGIAVLTQESRLVLHAGKRHLTLKVSELDHYRGERGRRGSKLPRGLQNVDYLVAEHPDAT